MLAWTTVTIWTFASSHYRFDKVTVQRITSTSADHDPRSIASSTVTSWTIVTKLVIAGLDKCKLDNYQSENRQVGHFLSRKKLFRQLPSEDWSGRHLLVGQSQIRQLPVGI